MTTRRTALSTLATAALATGLATSLTLVSPATADVTRSRLGIRAQAVERDGSLVDDFVVEQEDGVTSVRNAPSPAATSSLAIAAYVVDRML